MTFKYDIINGIWSKVSEFKFELELEFVTIPIELEFVKISKYKSSHGWLNHILREKMINILIFNNTEKTNN